MTFGRRLRFYFFGVILGFVAVYFISKNRDSNPWLPKEQIKAKLTSNSIHYSSQALCQINCLQIDTANIDSIINEAYIDFDKSDVRSGECPVYFLEYTHSTGSPVEMNITSCDKNAEIREVRMSNTHCDCHED